MGIWVDTDFGFDDLWALLVLRHLDVKVDGLSLVAGVSTLGQACRNALGARQSFDFQWTISAGAARPIKRAPESAERIVGPLGMRSRGRILPQDVAGATDEKPLIEWLADQHQAEILALGPLTNLANLYKTHPEQTRRINRITWMGGSSAHGNHTQFAEYNAIADPDALDMLVRSDAPLDIVDLKLCRQVMFNETHIPVLRGDPGTLLMDLVGGYLDIALSRGRSDMAIYDPIAAFVQAERAAVNAQPMALAVCTDDCEKSGQTVFTPTGSSGIRLVTSIDVARVRSICFAALEYPPA